MYEINLSWMVIHLDEVEVSSYKFLLTDEVTAKE